MWRGIAFYRAGQYDDAIQSFARIDSPESDFNQGNALAQQGQFAPAARRYEQALKRRPKWPAAEANLALVRKLIPEDEKQDPGAVLDRNGPEAEAPARPGRSGGHQLHGVVSIVCPLCDFWAA